MDRVELDEPGLLVPLDDAGLPLPLVPDAPGKQGRAGPEWWTSGKWSTNEVASVELVERSRGSQTFSTYEVTDKWGRRCQLRRVTTILRAAGKEGLTFWTAHRAAEEAVHQLQRAFSPGGVMTAEEFQKAVREAPERALRWYANRGSRAHRMVDCWLQTRDLTQEGIMRPLQMGLSGALGDFPLATFARWEEDSEIEWRAAYQSVIQFIRWYWNFVQALGARGFRIAVVHVERALADMELGYAGTTDLTVVCECGTTFFVDWKTSKAIHAEYDLQLAAYAGAAQKCLTGIDPDRMHGTIVRAHTKLPWELKEGEESVLADFQEWQAFHDGLSWQTAYTTFGAVLHLYEWRQRREWNGLPKIGKEAGSEV